MNKPRSRSCLALPGVLATLALAPWVIQIFYSSKFDKAAEILCWQVTGTFLQVNSWPMGFILLAKGRAAALFWTDLASYSVYVVLGWVGLKLFGLPGTGMAFLALYAFHWCVVYRDRTKNVGIRFVTHQYSALAPGRSDGGRHTLHPPDFPEPWATASVACWRLGPVFTPPELWSGSSGSIRSTGISGKSDYPSSP